MLTRIFCLLILFAGPIAAQSRQSSSFDAAWRFHAGDQPAAEQSLAPDADWQPLDLPHDWAIAGPFSPSNPSGGQGGFAPAGIGWYRKHFKLASAAPGRRVFIIFDGVMANSDYVTKNQNATLRFVSAVFRTIDAILQPPPKT